MIITILKEKLEKIDEKMILLAIIGNLEAIKNDALRIEEAEKFLFSPRMTKILEAKGCDENIMDLIWKGCELENIVSLIPEKLDEVIDEMKQEAMELLKNYMVYDRSFWIEEHS